MGEGAGRERRRWARKLDALVVHMVCGHCVKAQDGRGRTAVFNMENQQGPAVQPRELCSILCDNLMVTRGKDGGGIVRESGMDMDARLCLTWRTSKNLLHSPGNSAQCYVEAWMGGGFGGEWIHVYVWLSPFAVHQKPSQHCLLISYTPILNKTLKKFWKVMKVVLMY